MGQVVTARARSRRQISKSLPLLVYVTSHVASSLVSRCQGKGKIAKHVCPMWSEATPPAQKSSAILAPPR